MIAWILDAPVLAKVLGSLGSILLAHAVSKNLVLAVAVGTAMLAAWTGQGWADAGRIAGGRLASEDNLLLLVTVWAVIVLSNQLVAGGVMADLVAGVRARCGRETSMAVLPAMVGFLPMPGGALFSAPLVDACDGAGRVDSLQKTRANYWFRHIWEYWWPLYPGVLLAVHISGLEVWRFALLQLPMTLASVAAGAVFILRPVRRRFPGDAAACPTADGTAARGGLARACAPIAVVVAVYAGLETFWPAVGAANRYLPMLIGVGLAMGLQQCRTPLDRAQWRALAASGKTLRLMGIVAIIRVYGAFIEADLPGGMPLAEAMHREFAAWGIPTLAVVAALPFVSGMSTGIAIGMVGASLPVVMGLVPPDAPARELYATVALAYAFGYMGMILSPVHVCLIVTNEHFGTRLRSSLFSLAFPALVVLAAASVYAWILFP
ncbi:MAG: DUF401 family protein [Planctomycetota bacterium]